LRKRRRVLSEQTFLGKKNGANPGVHLADEIREIPAVDRWEFRTTEKFGGSRSVASDRSEYENLLIPIGAHPVDPSGIAAPV
jgi:hypothetical protein